MGFYGDKILPRITNVTLRGREFEKLRALATSGLDGEVLEVGFGTGLNVPHYPAEVTRVRAVDPATEGRKLAAGRVAASKVPVEYVDATGTTLPLLDASVDHALCTWTLCTIPDVAGALAEVRRVLRPGGLFHFVEHGLSPDPKVARMQHRLTPLQRLVLGGCHLDRPIDTLITDAGFELVRLENRYMQGPRVYGYTFEGVAAAPRDAA
jgi:ubiquinone/menaquinone biosynthesis C-methylase UbiE